MTDLWTPSDDLLTADPIANQKITNPHETPGLVEAGLTIPDGEDDAANEAAAAWCLAESAGDEAPANGESGECADDHEVADTDNDETIEDDI
jgi:hypothetical protein